MMISTIEPVPDKIIHQSIHVPLSPADAFKYFTNNSLLQTWLTVNAEVENHVGGKYELFWQPDDRENNSTIGCRITAYIPDQVVAFQWRSPKQFKSFANSADPLTHVVVAFIIEDTGTRIHLIHSGWRNNSEWEEARQWQEKAWNVAFEQFEKILKS